jgi:hypothetical protein
MKGNTAINKSLAKGIENGKIVQNLPEVQFGGRMVPLFTPISPVQCWVQSHKGTKPAMKKQPDTYRSSQFPGL